MCAHIVTDIGVSSRVKMEIQIEVRKGGVYANLNLGHMAH